MSAVLNHASDMDKLTFFMEECRRMGIKVLGPDINESQKGFAVNKSGEIRFGLGGLKGVGEGAVENIITERKAGLFFKDPFDFVKRVNQRNVGKKTLESLIKAGAFDTFTQFHRAQYFCVPDGKSSNALEKIIEYGNKVREESSTVTLFGDLSTDMIIAPPLIPNCPQWSLTEQLDHEKEIAGIYLSGHPLDHFRFEIKHYGISTIADFNEVKESNLPQYAGKAFKLLCLVSGAAHRVSRQGNKFGIMTVEDYSGKTEIALFGDNYVRFNNYLLTGQTILICGTFRMHNYRPELEFGISSMTLAENVKTSLTKQLCLEIDPRNLQPELVQFLEKNLKDHPGKSGLRITVAEPKSNLKVALMTLDHGLEMNHDIIKYLEEKPEIEVQVAVA
jgi:DNA polymerase-3 subunit alpha